MRYSFVSFSPYIHRLSLSISQRLRINIDWLDNIVARQLYRPSSPLILNYNYSVYVQYLKEITT